MTITWEQVLAFLCEDQTMAITSLLFLAFFCGSGAHQLCPAPCAAALLSAGRQLRLLLL